jgi:hypothetical protein
MGKGTKNNQVAIKGKCGELIAAAVMLSKYGLEVSIPESYMRSRGRNYNPDSSTRKLNH